MTTPIGTILANTTTTNTTTRRRFLIGGSSGAAMMAAGCACAKAAPSRNIIDTHHHFYAPEFKQATREFEAKTGAHKTSLVDSWTPEQSLAEMDRGGIRTAVVSLSSIPGVWFNKGPAAAREMSLACNDYAAAMVKKYPGRFGFWASLPMIDVDASLTGIAHALDELKADGIGLQTSYGDRWPGDPMFAPIFAELDRRHAVVFFHPLTPNCCTNIQDGVTSSVLEVPFDTTRCIVSLLRSGSFVKYPNIKWVFSHGGGALPMVAGRIAAQYRHDKNLHEYAPDGILATFAKLYYDTANAAWGPSWPGLRATAPISQILFGTDYPYFFVDQVQELPKRGLNARELSAVYHDNAKRLLPRLGR
ncbi:MAG TPA: amidohydrolase family protein [Stellaceae bacterium]|jgi:predicted TIM-barrel fold metal-dependent hydrolase|nr:amidohydrolase family protein [Stellaceae bacterium]